MVRVSSFSYVINTWVEQKEPFFVLLDKFALMVQYLMRQWWGQIPWTLLLHETTLVTFRCVIAVIVACLDLCMHIFIDNLKRWCQMIFGAHNMTYRNRNIIIIAVNKIVHCILWNMYSQETVTESKSGQALDKTIQKMNSFLIFWCYFLLKLHFRAGHIIYRVVTTTH